MHEVRDRNVYILGAGFSAPAGVPLIHDFIDRSRIYFDDPGSKLDKRDQEHFQRFLDFKQRMSQAREKVKLDLDNIEELFGLVEISHRLSDESAETRTSTVFVIAKTLELATRSQRLGEVVFQMDKEILGKRGKYPQGFYKPAGYSDDMLAADPYLYFGSLATGLLDDPDLQKSRVNTFITFNYDLLLEDALYKVGLAREYHLPQGGTVVDAEEPGLQRCSVLKLHGSTNWGVCTQCGQHMVVLSRDMFGLSSELSLLECEKCHTPTLQPFLIPPSWDKSEYSDIMRPVWSEAVKALEQASRICVIGYSMRETDSFFRYLIALALSQNHNLYRFIVVDSNRNIVVKYKKLLEPIFRKRRLSPFLDPVGFSAFLSEGRSIKELGRGELIWGNLSRR
jgi:NAD-dependent SIR2 family protein deacetylase